MTDSSHRPRIHAWPLAIAALLGPCLILWINPGSGHPGYIANQNLRLAQLESNQRVLADTNAAPGQRQVAQAQLESGANGRFQAAYFLILPFGLIALTIFLRQEMSFVACAVVAVSVLVANTLIATAVYSINSRVTPGVTPIGMIDAMLFALLWYVAAWAVLLVGAVCSALLDRASNK